MSREWAVVRTRAERARVRGAWLIPLAPRVIALPAPIQKFDDPFLPYCRTVFAATLDLVAGYIFDLAAFLALGAAGAIALERACAILAATPEALCVVHGPFARAEYASFVGEGGLCADGATVTSADVKSAFLSEGVAALVTPSPDDDIGDSLDFELGRATVAGTTFRVADPGYLERFMRDNFADALRAAVTIELI